MNESKIKLLKEIKEYYQERLDYYQVNGKELSRFSWAENKKVELHVFLTSNDDYFNPNDLIFFAVPSQSDNLNFKNIFDETNNNPSFEQLNRREKISWLVSNNYLHLKDRIIKSSINFGLPNYNTIPTYLLKKWAHDWVDNEYRETSLSLSSATKLQSFPTTNKKFFVDRYHFNDMLSTISDDQFTDEFNQCLFAYEHEKWFLCAAGLGSCLEHLMLLTLMNYSKQGSLGRNPTAKDYLKAFEKEPISIDSRQQTFIDTLFRVRNSVDHHNSGHTQKNLCDMLLDGVSDIFNDYFIPSTLVSDYSK